VPLKGRLRHQRGKVGREHAFDRDGQTPCRRGSGFVERLREGSSGRSRQWKVIPPLSLRRVAVTLLASRFRQTSAADNLTAKASNSKIRHRRSVSRHVHYKLGWEENEGEIGPALRNERRLHRSANRSTLKTAELWGVDGGGSVCEIEH